jgi:hypothetical protein
MWLINAVGLFRQVITGQLIGSGTAAATHLFKLTKATFPLQSVQVPQFLEQWGVPPYLAEALLTNISRHSIEIATALHLPPM